MQAEAETSVFARTTATAPIISATAYNLLIGMTLCWGFAVNYLMVKFIDTATIESIHPIAFLVGYFGSCMLGSYLFTRSDKPVVSFIGYNLVVLPFGLIINLVVSQYNPSLVLAAIRVTGIVTGGMMCLGSLFPRFFQKIAGVLSISLIIVIIVECVEIFIFGIHHSILDWAVAAIFCGYIGYDWGRANQIPKTVDNAIDSAAALYMDIVILFIRILRIMGRR